MKEIQFMFSFMYGEGETPQCIIDYERRKSRLEILKLIPVDRFTLMMRGPIK
jgi:hypothetical protein